MIMEEIKCDKCVNNEQTNVEVDVNGQTSNLNESLTKMVIAKCIDCNTNLCTSCLLEHQLISSNLNHKLVNLLSPIGEQGQASEDNLTNEINNNCISDKDLMFKFNSDENDSEKVIKRRLQHNNEANENAEFQNKLESELIKNNFGNFNATLHQGNSNQKQQQIQMQHLQQLQQYQLSQQLITNKLKQQQQQQQAQTNATNARLVQIESEITKTYNFYVQMLKERKEYLVKELNTIIQFALLNHSQNINKQLQIQYQLEMKKQQLEKEIGDDYETLNGLNSNNNSSHSQNDASSTATIELNLKNKLNLLNELNNLILVNNQLILQLKSNNPLMSIEFISNYSAIQTSIRNTFGYIRINPQTQQTVQQQGQAPVLNALPSSVSMQTSNMYSQSNNNNNLYANKNHQTSYNMGFQNNHHHHNQQSQLENNVNQFASSVLPNAGSVGSLNHMMNNELSILCDLKPLNNNLNVFSNSSTSTNISSLSSSSSSSSSSALNQNQNELITSPISIMMKKQQQQMEKHLDNLNINDLDGNNNHNHEAHLENNNDGEQQEEEDDDERTQSSETISSNIVNNQHNFDSSINMQKQEHNTMITLSAGSTSSHKSSKSLASNSSLSSSSSSSSNNNINGSTSISSAINLTNLSSNTKHPLSYLYSNFINSNPKLNTFNYLNANNASSNIQNDDHFVNSSVNGNGLKSINSSTNLNTLLNGNCVNNSNTHSAQSANASNSNVQHSSSNLTGQIQLQRSKMIYHCKFGEFGINDGQFTEPSGVTINTNNDIIVADTNSHRIQIFDKDGNFKFKFGECGKRDGQLLYPNRVSIVKQTGDIVVTERSPTHQIQIYNKYGQFLRKFGANILQHPRGVCVDYKGRIVVVECKVMRVIIFDLYGNVLNKFNCSKYLEFPNGVCCSNPTSSNNYKEEIYISDNRAHCIKVFDYNGNFIRQIGAEGITNYPIGVGINSNNEILVADNHNNFNLTVFTQDGKLINALESKVKHAQCFDVGLMDDGSIVLASKDYRIYVYKYTANSSNNSILASSSAYALEQQQPQLVLSPTSSTGSTTGSNSSLLNQANTQPNMNNYDFFMMDNQSNVSNSNKAINNNHNLYNLFSNPSGSNDVNQTSNHADPFADLHNDHLFMPSSTSNIGSLFSNNFNHHVDSGNQQLSSSSDNLNASFSSLLNMSSNNTNSNANNNLVSILNGIL